MKRISFLVLLVWGLSRSTYASAQQILCERQLLVSAPRAQQPAALLRLQADSLRLVSDAYPLGMGSYLQARVNRLALAGCDTLPSGSPPLQVSRTDQLIGASATTRRGQVLLARTVIRPRVTGADDSARIVVQLFNRNGTSRWRRTLAPQSLKESATGLIEAPENGFFLFGNEYYAPPAGSGQATAYDLVLRLDSTGRELWRRRYRRLINDPLANPAYTRAGTIVCTADFIAGSGVATVLTLMEFNQRGDSLATRPVVIVPQQVTGLYRYGTNALQPLRDGGFAIVGEVDSAHTGYFRPFLARLDRNLNLTWSYVYRAQATQNLRFAQPRELADGTLVVVASNAQSGRNYPFWLFRFSGAGVLQLRYPFVSQVLTPNTGNGRSGYFGVARGLQPLSDSTFMLAAADFTSSRIYLAHLRVPGLPRVIDSHYLPPAQPLARAPAGRAPGAALALFPNPAGEALTVRYAPSPGLGPAAPATLELRDALGRRVLAHALPAPGSEVRLAVGHLPAGLYTATLVAAGQLPVHRKLLIAR